MNKQWIIDNIGEEEVFRKYLGFFSYRKRFVNPLRNDSKPDCCFWKGKNYIYFNDFAQGKMYSCFQVVMDMYNLSFPEAINRIISDFNRNIDIDVQRVYSFPKKEIKEEKKVELTYVTKKWNKEEISFWKDYGISRDTLDYFNVKPIDYYSTNKIFISSKKEPFFAYIINDKVKIYCPKSKEKWKNNCTKNDVQGLSQLKYENKTLIITKSLKDVMALYELGYEAISLNSETSFIPESIFSRLQNKYDNIILLLDNDKTGIKMAQKFSFEYHIDHYFIGKNSSISRYGYIKDISDFIYTYGKQAAFKHLKRNLC